MRKYYYCHKNGFGCGIGYSNDSCFPLSEATKKLREEYGRSATISFWREISQSEFEKMNDIIDEANNEKRRNNYVDCER